MSPFHRIAPLALAAVLTAAAAPAAAQWTGRGEAGVVVASGNTETKAGNAKLALAHAEGAWSRKLGFAAVYAWNEATGTTAQRWEALGQADYAFNPRDFAYGGLRYERDKFGGFNYQGVASLGVGRKFIDTEETKFSAQIGVGYKFFETRDVVSPAGLVLLPGDTGNAMAVLAGADYRHAINASTTIIDKLTVEYTSDNTFIQNELALQVKMSDKLALALGYAVRHNTDPPAGFRKTDTLTTANVVYEIK